MIADAEPATRKTTTAPDATDRTGVTVLYVAGPGRSGSTILANTLGQVDGFFAVGELWNIWRRGLIEHRRCGCGCPVDACPIWSKVLRGAFGYPPRQVDAEHLDALAGKRLRARVVPVVRGARRSAPFEDDEYRRILAELYHAVSRVTDCRVIVDSSKSPIYAAFLATIPDIRVYVVHLIRDARAAAFSHSRVRMLPDFGDGRLMRREHPLTAARRWVTKHALTERLLPGQVSGFVNVRYEDFVDQPALPLGRILAMVGGSARPPLVGDRTVRLDPTHSVSGNPNRFRTGELELRLDDEWIATMPARSRILVTALTWPLLLRYDYPLWLSRDGPVINI